MTARNKELHSVLPPTGPTHHWSYYTNNGDSRKEWSLHAPCKWMGMPRRKKNVKNEFVSERGKHPELCLMIHQVLSVLRNISNLNG